MDKNKTIIIILSIVIILMAVSIVNLVKSKSKIEIEFLKLEAREMFADRIIGDCMVERANTRVTGNVYTNDGTTERLDRDVMGWQKIMGYRDMEDNKTFEELMEVARKDLGYE